MTQKPITSYYWNDPDSSIKQMDVFLDEEGATHVNIYHSTHGDKEKLSNLLGVLDKNGINNAYLTLQEKTTALHIRHIDSEENLLKVLHQSGAVTGSVEKKIHNVSVEKLPLAEKVKRRAMNYFGYFGIAGHTGVSAAGFLQNDPKRIQQGLLSLAQPVLMARYGTGKNAIDFEHMYDEMRNFYADENFELPRFNNAEKQKDFLYTVNRVISDNVIAIAYGLSILSNIRGLQSSVKQGLSEKTVGSWMRTGNNSLNLLGNTITMTVPEKKKTLEEHEQEKEKSLPEDLWETIKGLTTSPVETVQRNPIRVDNMLKLFGNGLLFYDLRDEYNKINHRWLNSLDSPQFKDAMQTLQSEAAKLGHNLDSNVITSGGTQAKTLLKSLSTMDEGGALSKACKEIQKMAKQHEIAHSIGGKLSVGFVAITATSFLAATLVAGTMGSKNRDPSLMTEDVYDQMYGLGAQTLIKLPKAMRTYAAKKMATYLATQPDVHDAGITAEQIQEEFAKRIALFEQSPWVKHDHVNDIETPIEDTNPFPSEMEKDNQAPTSVISSRNAEETSITHNQYAQSNTVN